MKLIIYILFLGSALVSCQIVTQHGESPEPQAAVASSPAQQGLKADFRKDERFSLSEDRAKFDELRKDIPADTKTHNDEKALYLEWMSDYRLEPSEIRSRFGALVSKKRENFNNEMNKIREQYNKEETSKKDAFTRQLEEDRSVIKDKDVAHDKKTEMYNDINNRRTEFFSKLRDDHESFEVDYRQKRKDFEDYVKEKSDTFNADLKEYTAKFNDLKKEKN